MNVKLVSVTPNPEAIIAYVARVSNPQNQDNPDYAKLIRYLVKNKHWSPFEHSFMTVEITTSMSIGEQLLRHRSFTFQKFSGRYSEFDDFESIELRKQATKNRQSSLEVFDPLISLDEEDTVRGSKIVDHFLSLAKKTYRLLLDHGVAREVARLVLPAATQTTMYMTGSARSWIHYLDLRTDEHTQKEHRLIALEIEKIFAEQYPMTYTAIQELREEDRIKNVLFHAYLKNIIQLPEDS